MAQAKFLRAFLAFDLVKYWGDVPFKTDYTAGYESAFNGTGMPIEATYAGRWSRPAGHPDDKVLVHPNAAGPERKAGAVI